MKELRITLLLTLFLAPLVVSSAYAETIPLVALDVTLAAVFLGVLPLLSVLLLWAENFQYHSWQIRYGASQRPQILLSLGRNAAALFFSSIAGAGAAIYAFRAPGDPLLGQDFSATIAIALAAASSFTLFFACARTLLGKWGLVCALGISWTLGVSDLALSALVPSGHIHSLLGVGDGLVFPGLTSFGVLYLGSFITGAWLLRRLPH